MSFGNDSQLRTGVCRLLWIGFLMCVPLSALLDAQDPLAEGSLTDNSSAAGEAFKQTAEDADASDARDDFVKSEVLFVHHVAKMLRDRCIGCHGTKGREIEGGLDLRSLQDALTGGDSGEPSLLAGFPDESPLFLAATRDSVDWSAMPPKETESLNADELSILKRWIELGAAWPSEERQREIELDYADQWAEADRVSVQTSGGLSANWTNRKYAIEDLWAYQPIADPLATNSAATTRERSDDAGSNGVTMSSAVDQLLAEIRPAELSVSPRADRRTLARRAYYDLTGLPPGPQEVDAFCQDTRSDREAFAALVDQLLDSPHYGERMAQHWLDVVRYADSSGFANDFERGNAWRYRDYVVRSFNQDKPFNQFVIEQIAGDEWVAAEANTIAESEARIAVGFLRMGPWELTGMEVAKVARQRFLDDVTNSVGEVFLGHSLQCARCHDHKFDPIPTRDYYSIQAVFSSTQLAERSAEFLQSENQNGFGEQGYLRKKERAHQAVIAELDEVLLRNAQQWYDDHPSIPEEASKKWREIVSDKQSRDKTGGVFNAARQAMDKAGFAEDDYPPRHVGYTPQQFGAERVARKGLQRLAWEFERYQPFALSVYNGRTPRKNGVYSPTRVPENHLTDGIEEKTCILTGGDPFSEADRVSLGVLSVVDGIGNLAFTDQSSSGDQVDGKRLAFARWVANDQNPLTARVIANRIWLWHFGRAIAGNPNNFGAKGKKPTHPRLLDWLAATLVKSGWSIKSLHREIMLSDAYCQSTEHPDPSMLAQLDSENVTYSAFLPRRLSAEELRDSMLVVSGELNRTIGGIPCRPEINPEIALQPRQVMGAFAAAWVPNPLPSDRHRRSLYILRLRGLVEPMLEVFNAPSPDFSCELRDASTITPQVFTLFNSENTYRRALVTAHRLLSHSQDDLSAIKNAFELAYGRLASEQELDATLRHWQKIETSYESVDVESILSAPPSEVIREAVEENTGERFRFTERLFANEDYVPDLSPEKVDRHVQSLADLCVILFNSNEFVYVY